MLYSVEVCADALRHKFHKKKLVTVQRKEALRVACAYRSVSGPAVLVIVGCTPLTFLPPRGKGYKRPRGQVTTRLTRPGKGNKRFSNGRSDGRSGGRQRTGHEDVNYYITQFLSGHDYFNAYLFRWKRKPSPNCDYCPNEADDAEHAFFRCTRWAAERRVLEEEIGVSVTPSTSELC
ncbi:uncharacterized protein LOC117175528 [Belonocnema kinseyi]|uniref:uncharacterized protein LOC117175528 n=1 Tax=Belonocnema kinseyi TaxID=2817044 RepID=UPI00143D103A|nr:uncharacterized protein LOC117175528 [Belonocnema kinseyi]